MYDLCGFSPPFVGSQAFEDSSPMADQFDIDTFVNNCVRTMTRLETCNAPLGSPYYQDIMNDATVRILDAVKASNNISQDVAINVKR